jgi:peptidoglycan hydrolase CwlO-like protein
MNILRMIILSVFALWIGVVVVSAATVEELQGKEAEYRKKIAELQGQEDSLSKQINLLNSQISLATLRMEATKNAADKLAQEIEELNDEIERLEALKTKRLELVRHRIPEAYKRNSVSAFGIVFFSQNVSDFLLRVKYLTKVQTEDAELYSQLQNTQDAYGERKDTREKKKEQQESLKMQLEQQSRELDRQKKQKQVLLDETRNSESVYQRLLAQALAEKQALERALVDSVQVGSVNKGDPIALVGNTGYPACSTGPHLHFEVRKNGSWVDPAGFVSSKSVYDDQSGSNWTVGSGSWDWPLSDPIRMTQRFGQTPWSYRYSYSGGIHTGFDLTSSSSNVIRAPAGGTLYSSSQSCGTSSVIKIKYIDHGDGAISFYLHVQ